MQHITIFYAYLALLLEQKTMNGVLSMRSTILHVFETDDAHAFTLSYGKLELATFFWVRACSFRGSQSS